MKEVATDLSFSMQQAQAMATAEELWDMFKTTLTEAVNTHIPHKTARTRYSQPWVTANTRKLIHRRDRVYKYKQMKKTGANKLKINVQTLQCMVQQQLC